MLITFEGLDGSGKTTQAKMLYDFLIDSGISVVLTREPGGTYIAEDIRSLLESDGKNMSNRTKLLLFSAARADHVEKIILPFIRQGCVVICDRYIDSTYAYQGTDDIMRLMISQMVAYACYGQYPSLTFYMKMNTELVAVRSGEQINLDSCNQIANNYDMELYRNPDRWFVINAEAPKDVCHEIIRDEVTKRIGIVV